MDHHGFLTLFRYAAFIAQQKQLVRNSNKTEWRWNGTPVIYPESLCPFCSHVIRSPGVWLLTDNGQYKYGKLIGAFFPTDKGKISLIMPSHPHDTGAGHLCLGKNPDGIALLASMPNIYDSPMGKDNIPKWIAKYWGHKCKEMVVRLKDWGAESKIKELEHL